MPRERITDPSTVYVLDGNDLEPEAGESVPKGAVPVQVPQLHVSWSKGDTEYGGGSHVQVSMQVDAKHVEERAKSNDDIVGFNWFYTDSLDRATINKMIRALRKARDAAFGRDE